MSCSSAHATSPGTDTQQHGINTILKFSVERNEIPCPRTLSADGSVCRRQAGRSCSESRRSRSVFSTEYTLAHNTFALALFPPFRALESKVFSYRLSELPIVSCVLSSRRAEAAGAAIEGEFSPEGEKGAKLEDQNTLLPPCLRELRGCGKGGGKIKRHSPGDVCHERPPMNIFLEQSAKQRTRVSRRRIPHAKNSHAKRS